MITLQVPYNNTYFVFLSHRKEVGQEHFKLNFEATGNFSCIHLIVQIIFHFIMSNLEYLNYMVQEESPNIQEELLL